MTRAQANAVLARIEGAGVPGKKQIVFRGGSYRYVVTVDTTDGNPAVELKSEADADRLIAGIKRTQPRESIHGH